MDYKVGDIIQYEKDLWVKIVGITPKMFKIVPLENQIMSVRPNIAKGPYGNDFTYGETINYCLEPNLIATDGRFSKKSIKKYPYTRYNGGLLATFTDHGD